MTAAGSGAPAPAAVRASAGLWQTVYAYAAVSRALVALPNTVPFVVGSLLGGLPWRSTALLTGWALVFYSYSCKVNDLADFRCDRFNAGRARSPILNGVVLPEQVGLWAAFELIVLSAAVFAAPLPGDAQAAFIGLLALTTYGNAFQKRSRVISPIVMDHLFGFTMAAPMVVCAALGGPIGAPVFLLAAAFFYQMVVLNSYSGNMKDLEHDLDVGAATTASGLGVRRTGPRTWAMPFSYRAFLIYAQGAATLALTACLLSSGDMLTPYGVTAIALGGCGVPALIRRIEMHVSGTPVDFPAGQSYELTRFVSRPPHLMLNAAAYLFAAAQLTSFWMLPLLVAVSLSVPRAVLLAARRKFTTRRDR